MLVWLERGIIVAIGEVSIVTGVIISCEALPECETCGAATCKVVWDPLLEVIPLVCWDENEKRYRNEIAKHPEAGMYNSITKICTDGCSGQRTWVAGPGIPLREYEVRLIFKMTKPILNEILKEDSNGF